MDPGWVKFYSIHKMAAFLEGDKSPALYAVASRVLVLHTFTGWPPAPGSGGSTAAV
jgi:hypothetical protein